MNIDQIRELILLLDDTSIAELELEGPEFKLCLRKDRGGKATDNISELQKPVKATPVKEKAVEEEPELVSVLAPMVGTFYGSPAPETPPFVEKDSFVEPGQTLCIVEAMKLMNEIKSEVRGKIVEILVENGQPVEYGQTMFLIARE